MRHTLKSCFLLAGCLAFAAHASAAPAQNPPAGLRGFDFLNYTYWPTSCAQTFPDLGPKVSVHKGQFKTQQSYYRIVDNKILYSDINGDGQEDAVIEMSCGSFAGNFHLTEILIYTLRQGKPVLLTRLDEREVERDYLEHYPDGFLWSMVHRSLKPAKGQLTFERYAEGPHAGPSHVVTMKYLFKGNKLVLTAKPPRRRSQF